MRASKATKRQAKNLFRLCLVDGLLNEDRARQVVRRVAAMGRRDSPAVLSQMLHLARLHRAAHTANVESAAPLTPDMQAGIEAAIGRRYGAGLTTQFVLRPALIGGVRIQVGSDVCDGSVLAGLKALERSF